MAGIRPLVRIYGQFRVSFVVHNEGDHGTGGDMMLNTCTEAQSPRTIVIHCHCVSLCVLLLGKLVLDLSGSVKVNTFLYIRNVSGEFIFILQMFTLQIIDKSTSYTFKLCINLHSKLSIHLHFPKF